MRQKKISCRQIYWGKISCAALLQEKNICLVPLGGKKIIAQSESSNPPAPPQKSNGPPLKLTYSAVANDR
jgi:hypothetical protein